MNFDNFADYICDNILEGWMDEASAEIQKTEKNNGVMLTGIVIRDQNNRMTPAIYLEDYYDRYLKGDSMSDIMSEIRKQYDWCIQRIRSLNIDITDYSTVKDLLIYRLVNYERNEEMIKRCPHIRMDDLALTFRWLAHRDSVGISTALVTNQELELWDVKMQDILLDAKKNTERIFPGKVMMMGDLLKKVLIEVPDIDESMPMYIITNEQQINGATVLLYDHFLHDFAEDNPGNYYILPSSIHEVILVPADKIEYPEELKDIVRHANNTVVMDTEFLSDSVYYYDSSLDSITRIA